MERDLSWKEMKWLGEGIGIAEARRVYTQRGQGPKGGREKKGERAWGGGGEWVKRLCDPHTQGSLLLSPSLSIKERICFTC